MVDKLIQVSMKEDDYIFLKWLSQKMNTRPNVMINSLFTMQLHKTRRIFEKEYEKENEPS